MCVLELWSYKIKVIDLLKLLIVTTLAGYLGRLYQPVDQYFIAQIGPQYLKLHSVASYFPMATNFLAIGIGFSLIVALNKAPKDEISQLIQGATFFSFMFAAIVVVTGLLSISSILSYFELGSIAGSKGYFLFTFAICTLVAHNTVAKYVSVAFRNPLQILWADGIGTLLNLAGNLLSLKIASNSEGKMHGIAISTIVSQIGIFSFTFGFRNIF
jgi:hypothetical protein